LAAQCFRFARLDPTGRTSLDVYAPDIPNVYDTFHDRALALAYKDDTVEDR